MDTSLTLDTRSVGPAIPVPIVLLELVVLPGVLPAVLEVLPVVRPPVELPDPPEESRVESRGDVVLPALGVAVRSPDIDSVCVELSELSRDKSDWDTVPVTSTRWFTCVAKSTPLLAISNTSVPPVVIVEVELEELDRVDPPVEFEVEFEEVAEPEGVDEDEDEDGLLDEDEVLEPVVELIEVPGPRTTCAFVSLYAA